MPRIAKATESTIMDSIINRMLLKVSQVSKGTGISMSRISQIRHGNAQPNAREASALETYFDQNIDFLTTMLN